MERCKLQVIGKLFKRTYKGKSTINDVNKLSDQEVKSEQPERLFPKKKQTHIFHYDLQICTENNSKEGDDFSYTGYQEAQKMKF